MNRIFKSILVGVAAAGLALIGTGAATASPVSSSKAAPEIIGGTKSPATPWAVQILYKVGSTTNTCTGSAITASWVLTASHCVSGVTGITVYYSNSTANRGPGIAVDKIYTPTKGDVALIHLSTAKPLSAYPTVAQSYVNKVNDQGTILGYGARYNSVATDGLYQANVVVIGTSTDVYNGPADRVRGDNGAAAPGDSGGPLFIGGKIVGVCSSADTSTPPTTNIHGVTRYSNLTSVRQWIKNVAGV
ncbi:S1 family peptidase [Psychromicrobium sp. YIM B11713]|uniref:S1 family peptidase n=1 Tax=Psychromicrobium sp. YIM B11713 TaxID=3145233 RepID=UPI00374FD22B